MKKFDLRLSATLIFGSLLLLGSFSFAETFVVTSRNDSGPGTLRAAIAASNTTTGVQTITFSVPGGNSITVFSALIVNSPTIIDGGKNQVIGGLTVSSPYIPAGCVIEFVSGSDGSSIKNLSFVNSQCGIIFYQSSNNTVSGCRFGIDWSENVRKNMYGMRIIGNDTVIGGATANERNVVTGNQICGISIEGLRARVLGNYIGTTGAGLTSGAFQNCGIASVYNGSGIIGGNMSLGEGNLIGGNYNGVILSSSGTTVCGNIFGLNSAQNATIPNGYGIFMFGATNNSVGLAQPGFMNIIAGNTICGIGLSANYNLIQNNLIGINSSGIQYSNDRGILIDHEPWTYTGAVGNLIGGGLNASLLQRNVISGNNIGIDVVNGFGNTICGNLIGTNSTGTSGLGNATGIRISGGSGNLIGGTNADTANLQGNVVSGNGTGVLLNGGAGNTVAGNTIGLNINGDGLLANQIGISVAGGNTGTTIGGAQVGLRNVISGNADCGIDLNNTTRHWVMGNYIGLNAGGTGMLKNNNAGIRVLDASNVEIGGLESAKRNLICGDKYGVILTGSRTHGITLSQNWLGLLSTGAPAGSPLVCAVSVSASAHDNMIGQLNAGNLIANTSDGIRITDGFTRGNAMFSNTITAFAGNGILLSGGGANGNMLAPVIFSPTTQVQGTASPNSMVELFLSNRGAGSRGGAVASLGATTANAQGNWSMMPAVQPGQYLCALATDSSNNTSIYSLNVYVGVTLTGQTPTPTVTPTPEVTLGFTVNENQIKAIHNRINPSLGESVDLYWRQAEAGATGIYIYNIRGDLVKTLTDGVEYPAQALNHLAWSGRNNNGAVVGSGIYVVYIRTQSFHAYTKVAVIK